MIDCATPPLKVTVLALPVNVPLDGEGCSNYIEVVRTGVNRIRGIDCEIAECRSSSAREGVRSIGSIINVEDRGKTRSPD